MGEKKRGFVSYVWFIRARAKDLGVVGYPKELGAPNLRDSLGATEVAWHDLPGNTTQSLGAIGSAKSLVWGIYFFLNLCEN